MSTKTCKQRVISRRTHAWVERYLPHVVPDYTESGYARCEACGQDIYVGQGPNSPYAQQVEEGEDALRLYCRDELQP